MASPQDDGRDARHPKDGERDQPKLETGNLTNGWKSSVFFDPGTKYIWSLALDDSGNLYVATGDHGQIFRVTPKWRSFAFF